MSIIITETELWSAIDAAVAASGARPAGSITAIEYAAKHGIPEATAREQLLRAFRAGRLSSVIARVPAADGRGRLSRCYFVPVSPEPQVPGKGKPRAKGKR